MRAFKNMAQLPHTRKSIAEKGQKDSIHCRIHKTVSDRENFWFSSWSISPLKAELYNLCWTVTMPEKRLKLPNLKYEWGVSQQITFGCLSHLIPIENNRCTTYFLRKFYCCQSCEVYCWGQSHCICCLCRHRTIKMWGELARTSPRAAQDIAAGDHGVPVPAILHAPHVLPVWASLIPPCHLPPCVPGTWVCKHETLTHVWSLSLCCASIPWPSLDATACTGHNTCVSPHLPAPHLLTRTL